MPVTIEPRGLNWINNVNMSTFGPLVSNVCWFIGSVAFTCVACILLLTPDGPSTINGVPTSHEAVRQLGMVLAGTLLGAWTGKTVAGVVDAQNKRKAHPAYATVIEAEAVKEAAKAGAPVTNVTNIQTKERPAAAPIKDPREPDAINDDERG